MGMSIFIGVLIGLAISMAIAGIAINNNVKRENHREKLYDQILILERRKHFLMSEIKLNLLGTIDHMYYILYQVKNGDTSNVDVAIEQLKSSFDMPDMEHGFIHSGEYERAITERDNDNNKYLETKQEYWEHYGEDFE